MHRRTDALHPVYDGCTRTCLSLKLWEMHRCFTFRSYPEKLVIVNNHHSSNTAKGNLCAVMNRTDIGPMFKIHTKHPYIYSLLYWLFTKNRVCTSFMNME